MCLRLQRHAGFRKPLCPSETAVADFNLETRAAAAPSPLFPPLRRKSNQANSLLATGRPARETHDHADSNQHDRNSAFDAPMPAAGFEKGFLVPVGRTARSFEAAFVDMRARQIGDR